MMLLSPGIKTLKMTAKLWFVGKFQHKTNCREGLSIIECYQNANNGSFASVHKCCHLLTIASNQDSFPHITAQIFGSGRN